MKIVKASLIALSLAAAGSVFAQAAGPDQNTLRLCDNVKYDCDNRLPVNEGKPDEVLDRIKKVSYIREIFMVMSRPVPIPEQTKIYIVKEEKAEEVTRKVVNGKWYEVIPTTPITTVEGKNWAYVPK